MYRAMLATLAPRPKSFVGKTQDQQVRRRSGPLIDSSLYSVFSLFSAPLLADALVDPLQDEIGDLQVVLVLHDHVADAAVRRVEQAWEKAVSLWCGRKTERSDR